MVRLFRVLLCCAVFFVPSLVASCACDGDDTDPTTTTGLAGTGGVGGGTNHGGTIGTAGSGGTETPVVWPQGPGKLTSLGDVFTRLPQSQGITGQVRMTTRDSTDKCAAGDAGVGGSAGTSGSAGSGGSGGSGGEVVSSCPSSYQATLPGFDISAIDLMGVQLALPTVPVFEPIDTSSTCDTQKQLIDNAHLYLADCRGTVQDIGGIFTPEDIPTFFGCETVLPQNTNLLMDGHPVSIITGLAVKSAICGSKAYVLTNVSSVIIELDLAADGGISRTDHQVGYSGLSGLMCRPDGTVLATTNRSYTVESYDAAANTSNPALLAEANPIHVISLDPATDTVTVIADVTGGSHVLPQNYTADIDGYPYVSGVANVLAEATDGDILVGDHVDGAVWKISPDGLDQTLLFETDRLFTGMTQAPNGVVFLALNPVADINCDFIVSNPIIAYYDEQNGTVVDLLELDHPDYASTLQTLCMTGVIERDYANWQMILGGGNFNDLAVDPVAYPKGTDIAANIFVTETARNATRGIQIVWTPAPDAGTGGSGGMGGAPVGGAGGVGGVPDAGGIAGTGGTP